MIYLVIEFFVVQGPSHLPDYVVKATIGSLSVEGRGKSKKEAKLHASKALLVHLHQVQC